VAQAQTPLYQFDGDGEFDRYGASVSWVGDVNDDGFDDFLVGAPENGQIFFEEEGYVRVHSGVDGALLLNLDGVQVGEAFGRVAAGAGDVNSDGHADIIVGTPLFGGPGGNSSGRVQVFSGDGGGLIHTRFGDVASDQMGFVVAGVGDVNGDGHDDFAACAYNSDVTIFNGGTVRVWSGNDGTTLYSWEGDSSNRHLGASISPAGDFDGDDYGDVIVGGGLGPVVIYSGQTGGILQTYPAPAEFDQWGESTASLGDITGDTVPDYIIGAPQRTLFQAEGIGYARVLNGATGVQLREFVGTSVGDRLGSVVDTAGYWDEDNVVDYLVTAPAAGNSAVAGYVRVYSGATGQVLSEFSAESNDSDLGVSAAYLGDLNGDGSPEIILGEPQANDPGILSGSVEVYSGVTPSCDPPTNYCLAFPNSTGFNAELSYGGSYIHSANNLTLQASSCPPDQSAIFFYGDQQQVQILGSGVLCVGGAIKRLPPVQTIDASGNVSMPFDLNNLPMNDVVEVGETVYFQLWFRDPADGGAGSNQSLGLRVTFCP